MISNKNDEHQREQRYNGAMSEKTEIVKMLKYSKYMYYAQI